MTQEDTMARSLETIKDQIQKLLAKAEGTDSEAEAQTFREHAERLMIKWGVEAAELEAKDSTRREDIVEVHRVYTGNYRLAFLSFAQDVAWGYGNLRTLQTKWNNKVMVYVIGHKSDVELFLQLLDSLERQAMAELHRWQKEVDLVQLRGWEHVKASRTFLVKFGSTVGYRLGTLRREAHSDVEPGTALVLASKKDRVEAWVGQQYPKLGKARGHMSLSALGGAAGRQAGLRASLGGKALGNDNKAVTA